MLSVVVTIEPKVKVIAEMYAKGSWAGQEIGSCRRGSILDGETEHAFEVRITWFLELSSRGSIRRGLGGSQRGAAVQRSNATHELG